MASEAELGSAMASAASASELAFFRAALGAFTRSSTPFQVVCTALSHGTLAPAQRPVLAAIRPRVPPRRLIVLDSSFNPPTLAHMQMASSAVAALSSDTDADACRLLLLLAVKNADKAPKPAAFEHRLALMLAMARDLHAARAAGAGGADAGGTGAALPIDIGLTAQPYFHEKSGAIAQSDFYRGGAPAPTSAGPEQVFLIGYDTLIRIFDAKYYTPADTADSGISSQQTPMQAALSPFLRRARLRVTTRPDDQWGTESDQKAWLQTLAGLGGPDDWPARIDLTSGPFQGSQVVSSTRAREAAEAQNWTQLSSLVGPSVLAWIQEYKLFQLPP